MVGFNDSIPAAMVATAGVRALMRSGSRVVQIDEITAAAMHRSRVDVDDDDELDREEHEEVGLPVGMMQLEEVGECSGCTCKSAGRDAGDGVRPVS